MRNNELQGCVKPEKWWQRSGRGDRLQDQMELPACDARARPRAKKRIQKTIIDNPGRNIEVLDNNLLSVVEDAERCLGKRNSAPKHSAEGTLTCWKQRRP